MASTLFSLALFQALYKMELSKFKRPAKTELEGIKTSELPGPSALLAPGKRDGQTKMVNEGGTISVHSWSESEQKWTKIGDVVGEPGKSDGGQGSAPDGGKVTYEGKEYDFVFDIELDDTGGKLKLPYNKSEDAWMAAQNFIHKHELPQGYLDTIANFIYKNSGGGGGGFSNGGGGGGHDPFTGGGAYTTGSSGGGGGFSNGGGGGGRDPFTGGGAYTTGTTTTTMDVDNTYFPQKEFLSFSLPPKVEAMVSKLKQFNDEVPLELRLTEQQLERMQHLCNKGEAN